MKTPFIQIHKALNDDDRRFLLDLKQGIVDWRKFPLPEAQMFGGGSGETKMKSVEHSMSFAVPQPVSRVFPLFSPEGEKHWVPGWDYENVMGTKELSEDYVFLTKSHDHAAAEAVWLVKRYRPDDYCVEFYKVEPGDKVGVVKVCCEALAGQHTQVAVTYRYIALSGAGEAFVSGFTAEAYREFITEWQRLLSDYFAANG